jgi:glycosyltransferase involved in cell wall biosynthesis
MRKEKVKVSVILATYNRAELLRRCITSLLLQTFKNFELLVVDDGSADNTEEVVRSFTDNRIKYIKYPHRGVYANRNAALKISKGKYIAVADDDDAYHPNHLRFLLDEFEKDPKLGCAYGGTNRYYMDGTLKKVCPPKEFSVPRLLWGTNTVMHGTTMWNRKWMEKCPYPTKFDFAGDYIFFLDAAQKGCKFKSTGKITYSYFEHADSISSRVPWQERIKLCELYIREYMLKFPPDKVFQYGRQAAYIGFERYLEEQKPKVSVLILYYNQEKLLQKCLESVIKQLDWYQNYEIVIANDGSPHPNLNRYKGVDIKYFWHQHGKPSRATLRNMLWKISSGEILLNMDSDMTLGTNFFMELMQRHYENKGLILIHGIREHGVIRRFHNSRMWQNMGGAFSMRKAKALDVGLQDECYNGHWGFEDTDWAYRASLKGIPMEYARDVYVDHTPHPHNDLGEVNRKKFEQKHKISTYDR